MDFNTLLKEALALPEKDRAYLLVRILESLDNLSDSDAQRLWTQEAQRRAREIDHGATVELISDEVLEEQAKPSLK